MKIYIAPVLKNSSKDDIQQIEKLYAKNVSDKVLNSKSVTYKLRRLTSRLMMVHIFNHLNIPLKELKLINYNTTGSLITPGNYNLSFSYSHQITACLVSEVMVGLDIEYIKLPPKPQHIKLLATLTSQSITNPLDFYKLWTRLESVAKSHHDQGLGSIIYGKMNSDNRQVRQYLFNNEYLLSIASADEQPKLNTIYYINAK